MKASLNAAFCPLISSDCVADRCVFWSDSECSLALLVHQWASDRIGSDRVEDEGSLQIDLTDADALAEEAFQFVCEQNLDTDALLEFDAGDEYWEEKGLNDTWELSREAQQTVKKAKTLLKTKLADLVAERFEAVLGPSRVAAVTDELVKIAQDHDAGHGLDLITTISLYLDKRGLDLDDAPKATEKASEGIDKTSPMTLENEIREEMKRELDELERKKWDAVTYARQNDLTHLTKADIEANLFLWCSKIDDLPEVVDLFHAKVNQELRKK